ncbi:hypothetical protein HELRODRAFT_178437 [Helobdella robusta]|uniref:Uncharacterized protein n=1 Tax=Helobdella robusta TaxID=6412 RepID=T1FD61_HELRO|nr:hypothetical protein HELRODRAFT_178437 [Helobdella robusta]ESN97004.1 hypothetical protein HELRODRAFT_178437 [Helobdella robusta]
MACKQNLTINEVLCYLSNNYEFLNNDIFINNASDFYSSEEISAALKLIKHDVNLLKIDVNFDTPRGPKKKDKRDKLRKTIRYLGLVREKKLSTELPTYVSSNLRVPNNDSILKFNFNEIKSNICNMLHNQQLYLCSMLNAAPRVHKSELNNTNNTQFQL